MGVPFPRSPYQPQEEIKEGVNKGSWICCHAITGKLYILHCFDDNHEGAQRIELLKKCGEHSHIVQFKGKVELYRKKYYLVFEHMEHTLEDLEKTLNEEQVKSFLWQLLSGLQHCHSRGILLKDLNKSNVLLDDNGMVKIAIFGQIPSSSLNEGFTVMNPPVLLVGEVEDIAAANMWTVGCILLELMGVQPDAFPNYEMKFFLKELKPSSSSSVVADLEKSYTTVLAESLKNFPPYIVPLLKSLFALNPKDRGTPQSHLDSEFFTQKSQWDPSNPPKFPLMQRQRDTGRKACSRWPRMSIYGCWMGCSRFSQVDASHQPP